jgi:hypothetical protein
MGQNFQVHTPSNGISCNRASPVTTGRSNGACHHIEVDRNMGRRLRTDRTQCVLQRHLPESSAKPSSTNSAQQINWKQVRQALEIAREDDQLRAAAENLPAAVPDSAGRKWRMYSP